MDLLRPPDPASMDLRTNHLGCNVSRVGEPSRLQRSSSYRGLGGFRGLGIRFCGFRG